MAYRFTISDFSFDSKRSNSFTNALKYAKELAKERVGNVITIECNRGIIKESFVWCSDSQDIIPAY